LPALALRYGVAVVRVNKASVGCSLVRSSHWYA